MGSVNLIGEYLRARRELVRPEDVGLPDNGHRRVPGAKPHPGGGLHRLRHPIVGDLELHYEKFAVTGADGQLLVVYHADPGSPSADGLALLRSLPDESVPDPAGAHERNRA